jgi:hypothetical protein
MTGTWVTVEGYPGRWEIVHRGVAEQRRHPHEVRVKAEGHPLNASVALALVTPCPAPGTDPDNGPRFAQQAVQTGNGQVGDGIGEWNVYAADGGAYVGELWHNSRGEWSAYRRGHGASVGAYTRRAEALAAVGWLDTVDTGSHTTRPTRRANPPQ